MYIAKYTNFVNGKEVNSVKNKKVCTLVNDVTPVFNKKKRCSTVEHFVII